MTEPLLRVDDLTIGYPAADGMVQAVRGASFTVEPGERIGIVGESGSGKSTLALALMRLLPAWAQQVTGTISLLGEPLESIDRDRLRQLRGGAAAMVFQDPNTSFDPLRTIGDPRSEGRRAHGGRGRDTIRSRAVQVLRSVGMPTPESQLRRYPHELSGGMRQRSLIALGLQNSPRLLIADEPTTALDVTIQAQILELLGSIATADTADPMGLVLVSHNLGLVRQLCTRVIVMYGGRIVEDAPAEALFAEPRHPYALALLGATPRIGAPRGSVTPIPGQPVDVADAPPGCPFEPRCPVRLDRCATEMPPLIAAGSARRLACWANGGSGVRAVAGDVAPAAGAAPVAALASAEPIPSILDVRSAVLVDDHSAATARPVLAVADVESLGTGDDSAEIGPTLVDVRDVSKTFRVPRPGSVLGRKAQLRAVGGVDLQIRQGETVALVGESGSGKSTLARLVLGLLQPTSGQILVEGDNPARRSSPVRDRQRIQAVFQDPHASLDPRQRVREIIGEPLRNAGVGAAGRRVRVSELLDEVRLPQHFADRRPHELSGGQAQRVAIARALAVMPALIVLDEPTASLDVSIQTHVISLLRDLQQRHGLTYLFVSHDLVAVRELATRVAVMYLGRIVEVAGWREFFARPLHPYAAALMSAVPKVDADPEQDRRIVLAGEPPSPIDIPSGCAFHPRCPVARDVCSSVVPDLLHADGRSFACHFPGTLAISGAQTAEWVPGGVPDARPVEGDPLAEPATERAADQVPAGGPLPASP
jgi:peptide/nickel transport system ATP-binding protein